MESKITYLDIQRLSTEDGPGLRTTVFFKGCPLHCLWCHNPESLNHKPEIMCLEERCMGCSLCEGACPNNARRKSETNRSDCDACGACAEACPTASIENKGVVASASALAKELLRDRAYWSTTGGVTLSGGEPTSQSESALELLRLLKRESVHTALDTCGLTAWETLKEFLQYTDLFLYDLKLADPNRHKHFTGVDNEIIRENARKLHDSGAKLMVRTPIIPGATDDEENIRLIGEFIGEHLPDIERWELCSFNNLGRDKYKRLGKTYDYLNTPLMDRLDMERLCDVGLRHFPRTIWTGRTRLEK